MRRRLDTYEGGNVEIGDVVFVQATVMEVLRSEELLVRFLSKTGDYEGPVRTDACELDIPDVGPEPQDGSVLLCVGPHGREYAFRRNDAGAYPRRAEQRHDLHWWSYVDEEWVHWPYVVRHGGGEGRVLPPTVT